MPLEVDPSAPLKKTLASVASDSAEPHPRQIQARNFISYCKEIGKAPVGREFLDLLSWLAGPTDHAPVTDPVLMAHRRGRSEVVALLTGLSAPQSPDGFAIFPAIEPPNTP